MAHVVTTPFNRQFNAAGDAVTATIDAGSSADRVMLVLVQWPNSAAHAMPDAGVTYNGVGMTALGATVAANGLSTRLYRLVAPASGSNDVSVNPDAGVGDVEVIITVAVYDDVDQTTPEDGYTTATGTDTTADLTVTSATGDTPVFFAAVRALGPGSMAETNYTERVDAVNTVSGSSSQHQQIGGGEGTGAASVAFTGTITATAVNGWNALGLNLNAAPAGPTAALSGTVEPSATESEIVAGGETVILTLTDDTWVANGATFNAQRQNIINGIVSAQSETNGWNAERSNIGVTAVARTSSTVVTITLPALANYAITATETLTVTIPATALVGGEAIVASPTFQITATAAPGTVVGSLLKSKHLGNPFIGSPFVR